MIGGVLFFIIEYKFGRPDTIALSQLFLELLCASSYLLHMYTQYRSSSLSQPAAAKTNKSIDFHGMRIYGLLTNLFAFKFYSYDPSTNQLYFDETIYINTMRTTAFADMINGTYLSLLK
jgi:hypothetical protein